MAVCASLAFLKARDRHDFARTIIIKRNIGGVAADKRRFIECTIATGGMQHARCVAQIESANSSVFLSSCHEEEKEEVNHDDHYTPCEMSAILSRIGVRDILEILLREVMTMSWFVESVNLRVDGWKVVPSLSSFLLYGVWNGVSGTIGWRFFELCLYADQFLTLELSMLEDSIEGIRVKDVWNFIKGAMLQNI